MLNHETADAPLTANSEAGTATPLDLDEALRRVGGNRRLVAELAAMLLEDCAAWQAELVDQLREGNTQGLYLTAHAMRGSLAALGARPACEAARELEALGRANDIEGAARAHAHLEATLSELKPVLAALTNP